MISSVFLAGLLLAPLFIVFAGLLLPAGEHWGHVASNLLPRYLVDSLLLCAGTGLLALVFGTSTAWLVSFYDFPGRRFLEWALVLPLAVPAYIGAFAYAGLFDYTGPVESWLRRIFGGSGAYLPFEIQSLPGLILVMASVLYPYVYLTTRGALVQQSARLIEAAQLMGLSPLQVFARVALPLARPAMMGGLALVLMETLNDYGAVHYYGVDTLTIGIFRSWFSLGDLDAAIRLASILMGIALLILVLERKQRGAARFESLAADAPHRRREPDRGRWAATAVCLIPFSLGFGLPSLQLLIWTAQTGGGFGFGLTPLIFNSFLLAAAAALLAVSVSLVIAYSRRLHRQALMSLVSRLTVVGYSIPGAVIAVGVLLLSSSFDSVLDGLLRLSVDISPGLIVTGSIGALVFAYLCRFLAVAFNATQGGLETQCGSLDEASRTLGKGPLETLFRVNIPLVRASLAAGGLLVFVDVIKELPLTLILRPFNFDTLATKVFETAGDERVAQSAGGALIIVVTSLLPIVLINRLFSRAAR